MIRGCAGGFPGSIKKADTSELVGGGPGTHILIEFFALTSASGLNGGQFCPRMIRSVDFSFQKPIHMFGVPAIMRGTHSPPALEPYLFSSFLIGSRQTSVTALLESGVF